jgi:GNAT superfamily N-acetyltransferase
MSWIQETGRTGTFDRQRPQMCRLSPPYSEGYVSELFVAESARGAGLGTKLLEAVKDLAIGRGCSRLMLVNRKTRESYKRGFYRKLGWEERQEFANFVLSLPGKR